MANSVGGSNRTGGVSGVNNVSDKKSDSTAQPAATEALSHLEQGLRRSQSDGDLAAQQKSRDDGQGTLSGQSNQERDDQHNSADILATTHPKEQRPDVTFVHQQGESAASGGGASHDSQGGPNLVEQSGTGSSPTDVASIHASSPSSPLSASRNAAAAESTPKKSGSDAKAGIKKELTEALNAKKNDSQIADDLVDTYGKEASSFLPEFLEAFGEVLAEKGVAKAGVFHEFFLKKPNSSIVPNWIQNRVGHVESMQHRFETGFGHRIGELNKDRHSVSLTAQTIMQHKTEPSAPSCLESLGTALALYQYGHPRAKAVATNQRYSNHSQLNHPW
jgi:hypothetical protein